MTRVAGSIVAVIFFSLVAGAAGAVDSTTYSYSAETKTLIASGQYYKAIEELKRAFSLFPYNETLRQDLASAYLQQGQRELKQNRYPEAVESFGQARELYPEERQLALMRGVAYYLAKNYDSARAELAQAGEGADPLIFLGKVSYDTGDLQAAISYWRRAQELAPKDAALKELIDKAERELPVESKMDKGYSSMFDISYDAELPPGLAAEVLDALESAYNSVGADLGVFPTTRIPVLLYTKSDYSSVTVGPDWSGGLYDGKIRLPVGGITTMPPQMRAILFHEYTHVLVASMTGGNVPTWFNEGLAQLEEYKEYGATAVGAHQSMPKGKLLSLKTLSGSFLSMDRNQAGVAYRQSYSITGFMVKRYGWYAVQGILKNLGERVPMETAVAKALSDWSLDLPGVMQEWRESVGAGTSE